MEFKIECSEILNDEYSQFIDGNSHIYLNEESFVTTPFNAQNFASSSQHASNNPTQNNLTTQNPSSIIVPSNYETEKQEQQIEESLTHHQHEQNQQQEQPSQQKSLNQLEVSQTVPASQTSVIDSKGTRKWEKPCITKRRNNNVLQADENKRASSLNKSGGGTTSVTTITTTTTTMAKKIIDMNKQMYQPLLPPSSVTILGEQQVKLEDIQPTFRPMVESHSLAGTGPQNQNSETSINKSTSRRGFGKGSQQSANKKIMNRQRSQNTEPEPVFDCLYCCGEKEHYIYIKKIEQILGKKYAGQEKCVSSKKAAKLGEVAKTLLIIKLEEQYKRKQSIGNEGEEEEENVGEQDENDKQTIAINQLEQSQKQIKQYVGEESSKSGVKPLLLKAVEKFTKKKRKEAAYMEEQLLLLQKGKKLNDGKELIGVQVLDYQQNKKQQQMVQESMLLCQLFPGANFEIGMCVNGRERKRLLRKNISFDSEIFNIYDPSFTSEEELDSMGGSCDSLNGLSSEQQEEFGSYDSEGILRRKESKRREKKKQSLKNMQKKKNQEEEQSSEGDDFSDEFADDEDEEDESLNQNQREEEEGEYEERMLDLQDDEEEEEDGNEEDMDDSDEEIEVDEEMELIRNDGVAEGTNTFEDQSLSQFSNTKKKLILGVELEDNQSLGNDQDGGQEIQIENQDVMCEEGSSLSSIQRQDMYDDEEGFNESSAEEVPQEPAVIQKVKSPEKKQRSDQKLPQKQLVDFYNIRDESELNQEDQQYLQKEQLMIEEEQKQMSLKKRQKLKGISSLVGGQSRRGKRLNEDESEKLTFGCATPPQEEQKVTFSQCGDNSLSPVRTVKSYIQQKTLDDYADLSSSNKKNALMLDQSPISQQEITAHNIINQLQTNQNDQSNSILSGGGIQQQNNKQSSNNQASNIYYGNELLNNQSNIMRVGVGMNNQSYLESSYQPFVGSSDGLFVIDQTEEEGAGLSGLVSQQRMLIESNNPQSQILVNNYCMTSNNNINVNNTNNPYSNFLEQEGGEPFSKMTTMHQQEGGDSLYFIQQKSYDTDIRVMGNLLSQISKPTDESKEGDEENHHHNDELEEEEEDEEFTDCRDIKNQYIINQLKPKNKLKCLNMPLQQRKIESGGQNIVKQLGASIDNSNIQQQQEQQQQQTQFTFQQQSHSFTGWSIPKHQKLLINSGDQQQQQQFTSGGGGMMVMNQNHHHHIPQTVHNNNNNDSTQQVLLNKLYSHQNAENNLYLEKVSKQILNKKRSTNTGTSKNEGIVNSCNNNNKKNFKFISGVEEYQFDMKKISIDQMIKNKQEQMINSINSQQDSVVESIKDFNSRKQQKKIIKPKVSTGGVAGQDGIGTRVQTEGMSTPIEFEKIFSLQDYAKTHQKKNNTISKDKEVNDTNSNNMGGGGGVISSRAVIACSTNRAKQTKNYQTPTDFSQIQDYQKQQKKLSNINHQTQSNNNIVNQYAFSGSKSVSSKSKDISLKPQQSLNDQFGDVRQTNNNNNNKGHSSFMSSSMIPKMLVTSSEFPLGKMNNFLVPTQQSMVLNNHNSSSIHYQNQPIQKVIKVSYRDQNFRSALCSNRYSTTSDNQVFMQALQSASIDRRNEEDNSQRRYKGATKKNEGGTSKSRRQQHKRDISKLSSQMPSKKSKIKSTQKSKKVKNSSNQRQKSITKSNILDNLLFDPPTQTTIQYCQFINNNENKQINNRPSQQQQQQQLQQLPQYQHNTIGKVIKQKNSGKQNIYQMNGNQQLPPPSLLQNSNAYMSIQESKSNLYPTNDQISTIQSSCCNHYTNNSRKNATMNLNGSLEESKNSYKCFLDNKHQQTDLQSQNNSTNIGIKLQQQQSIKSNSVNSGNGLYLISGINQEGNNNGKVSQRGSVSMQRQITHSQQLHNNINGFTNLSGCCFQTDTGGEKQMNESYRYIKKNTSNTNALVLLDHQHQQTNINPNTSSSNCQFSFSQSSLKLNLTNLTTNLNKQPKNAAKKKKNRNQTSNNIQINSTSSSSTLKNNSCTNNKKKNNQRTRSNSKQSHQPLQQNSASSNNNILSINSQHHHHHQAPQHPSHQLLMTQHLPQNQVLLLKNQAMLGQQVQPIISKQSKEKNTKLKKLLMQQQHQILSGRVTQVENSNNTASHLLMMNTQGSTSNSNQQNVSQKIHQPKLGGTNKVITSKQMKQQQLQQQQDSSTNGGNTLNDILRQMQFQSALHSSATPQNLQGSTENRKDLSILSGGGIGYQTISQSNQEKIGKISANISQKEQKQMNIGQKVIGGGQQVGVMNSLLMNGGGCGVNNKEQTQNLKKLLANEILLGQPNAQMKLYHQQWQKVMNQSNSVAPFIKLNEAQLKSHNKCD